MVVIKTEDEKAEIIRNKRRGWKLIVKKVNLESTKNRCIWCSLRFFICSLLNNPCDLFLPDIIFFEDAKNNTRRRRKGKIINFNDDPE